MAVNVTDEEAIRPLVKLAITLLVSVDKLVVGVAVVDAASKLL